MPIKNLSIKKGNRYKHGGTGTRLYRIWKAMRNRCNNSNNLRYKDYGGRGITICPEWTDKLNGFINFRNWSLSNGYLDNLTIDRKENNKGYYSENCRWITYVENNQNQRTNKLKKGDIVEIKNIYKTNNYTQLEISKIYGVSLSTIFNILNNKSWKNIVIL